MSGPSAVLQAALVIFTLLFVAVLSVLVVITLGSLYPAAVPVAESLAVVVLP